MSEIVEDEMIEPKVATEKALAYLKETIKGASDPRVEEVEKSQDETCWVVTFGYQPTDTEAGLPELFSRKYKQVSISIDNGDFVSIKSRIAG